MVALIAERVAEGLHRPVLAASPPGDDDRLFILEQHAGTVRVLRLSTGRLEDEPFLRVGPLSDGDEQGLLGLVFAPDFARSGQFYVNFTDSLGATNVRRYSVSTSAPDTADHGSAATVLRIAQPFANHNGGGMAFGPDGMLYIGTGDGGGANDPGRRAQSLGQLLGKMLRIDVMGDDFPGDPERNYRIPADNPFRDEPGAKPEIWSFGLRNPWRFSFDRETGDLYIGDVGQGQREEIDIQAAASKGGENYGWRIKEGTRPTGLDPDPGGLVDPVFEYTHAGGRRAVIGGYVYRGAAVPELRGTYFFADMNGTLFSFEPKDGMRPEPQLRTAELFPDGVEDVYSFGEDAAGELYVCVGDGSIYRIVAGP